MSGDGEPRLSEGVIVLLVGLGTAVLFSAAVVWSGRSLEVEDGGGDASELVAWTQKVEQLKGELQAAEQGAVDRQATIDRLNEKLSQVRTSSTPDPEHSRLEARMAEALAAQERLKQENRNLTQQLDEQLSEALAVMAEQPAEVPEDVLPEARSTQDVDAKVLSDVRVSNVQLDLELAILDVGRVHGVRPGMSFRVLRDNRTIANVVVDDVRDEMTGATIQSTEKNMVPQVGDRAVLVTSN